MKDHQLLLRNYGNYKKGPLEAECVGPLKQVMLGILDFKYDGKFWAGEWHDLVYIWNPQEKLQNVSDLKSHETVGTQLPVFWYLLRPSLIEWCHAMSVQGQLISDSSSL